MSPLTQESAELLAIEALSWVASEDDLLPTFLGVTGASVDDLRQRATDTDFLVSVLDFLMMNDAWVTAFCDSANYTYDLPIRARNALPGGAQVNWT